MPLPGSRLAVFTASSLRDNERGLRSIAGVVHRNLLALPLPRSLID